MNAEHLTRPQLRADTSFVLIACIWGGFWAVILMSNFGELEFRTLPALLFFAGLAYSYTSLGLRTYHSRYARSAPSNLGWAIGFSGTACVVVKIGAMLSPTAFLGLFFLRPGALDARHFLRAETMT